MTPPPVVSDRVADAPSKNDVARTAEFAVIESGVESTVPAPRIACAVNAALVFVNEIVPTPESLVCPVRSAVAINEIVSGPPNWIVVRRVGGDEVKDIVAGLMSTTCALRSPSVLTIESCVTARSDGLIDRSAEEPDRKICDADEKNVFGISEPNWFRMLIVELPAKMKAMVESAALGVVSDAVLAAFNLIDVVTEVEVLVTDTVEATASEICVVRTAEIAVIDAVTGLPTRPALRSPESSGPVSRGRRPRGI